MKVAVSYDKSGRITTLFEPHAKSGKTTLKYRPRPGELHTHLDVPKEHEGKNIGELAALLKIETRGAKPTLVEK